MKIKITKRFVFGGYLEKTDIFVSAEQDPAGGALVTIGKTIQLPPEYYEVVDEDSFED